jgi:hypothetical protein
MEMIKKGNTTMEKNEKSKRKREGSGSRRRSFRQSITYYPSFKKLTHCMADNDPGSTRLKRLRT